MIKIRSKNQFGKWLVRFCNDNSLSEDQVINKFGRDSRRTIKLWFKGLGHPKSVSYIMLLVTLSKLTGKSEESLYLESSRAILRDG